MIKEFKSTYPKNDTGRPLEERDIKIFKFIGKVHIAASNQIRHVFWPNASQRRCNDRLKTLRQKGLIAVRERIPGLAENNIISLNERSKAYMLENYPETGNYERYKIPKFYTYDKLIHKLGITSCFIYLTDKFKIGYDDILINNYFNIPPQIDPESFYNRIIERLFNQEEVDFMNHCYQSMKDEFNFGRYTFNLNPNLTNDELNMLLQIFKRIAFKPKIVPDLIARINETKTYYCEIDYKMQPKDIKHKIHKYRELEIINPKNILFILTNKKNSITNYLKKLDDPNIICMYSKNLSLIGG